jgi:16S rRNA (adenine1518-N6/adenine1519-N6)-dimethyltransferase
MIGPANPEQSLLSQTKWLLNEFDLRAKKRLGQHFLVNSGILNHITKAADLSPSDLVLEIGPGLGVLTGELVEQAGWVIAVELDTKMADMLHQTLASCSNISIINGDILESEPLDLIHKEKAKFPPAIIEPFKYKLVANLPYYITQPIIRHFCEAKLKPQTMIIMVQKEVAKNIVAQPDDMSILAISVQFYGQPQIMGYVPAANFYPAPKVDSAILKITLYPEPHYKVISEQNFFKVVRAGFCAARKQIGNSLAQGLDIPKAEALSLLEKAGIAPQKRPETIPIESWARLENAFSEAGRKC